ncbi:hypothetical protein [Streptomyces sp. NPDC001286]
MRGAVFGALGRAVFGADEVQGREVQPSVRVARARRPVACTTAELPAAAVAANSASVRPPCLAPPSGRRD